MPLDPKAKIMLNKMKGSGMPPIDQIPIEDLRKYTEVTSQVNSIDPKPVESVHDQTIPGPGDDLLVRIYYPLEKTAPFPLLLYFHGGGFVMGSLDSHDSVCRELCAGSGFAVMSVGYRLAPENKFPCAVEDCLAAARWAAAHAEDIKGNAGPIVVGGDSAGANLATVTAMRVRDEGGPHLAGQLLFYPTTVSGRYNFPSHLENGAQGYFITLNDIQWFQKTYLRNSADTENPWVSPLLAPDLSRLPPALIMTAEYDPLRDEGERYADRLEQAGVPTRLICYEGMIHGFIHMGMFEQTGQAMHMACAWLTNLQ